MAEHHIVDDPSAKDYQIILRCTDCDDVMDCGFVITYQSWDEIIIKKRIFHAIHAPGRPRSPAVSPAAESRGGPD